MVELNGCCVDALNGQCHNESFLEAQSCGRRNIRKSSGCVGWCTAIILECTCTLSQAAHLPNQLAPKTDSAEASDRYPTTVARLYASVSRRARRFVVKP